MLWLQLLPLQRPFHSSLPELLLGCHRRILREVQVFQEELAAVVLVFLEGILENYYEQEPLALECIWLGWLVLLDVEVLESEEVHQLQYQQEHWWLLLKAVNWLIQVHCCRSELGNHYDRQCSWRFSIFHLRLECHTNPICCRRSLQIPF